MAPSYTIDINSEQLLTLAKAAQELPGGPVHVATVHRWRMKGVRDIKLPTVLIGGIRHTSREAIAWWCQQTTAAANGTAAPAPNAKQREKAISDAEARLAAAGI